MPPAAISPAAIVVCCAKRDSASWVGAGTQRRPVVLGTKVETRDGRLTGRFATPNCYGPEKVRRIREVFPDRDNYHLTAFGDSRGDKEMLDYADQGYYKPFR